MVELILVSVGVVAVMIFLWNVRGHLSAPAPVPRLDGTPNWVAGSIVAVTTSSEYLGMAIATIELNLGARTDEAVGPIPPAYREQIAAGLAVRARVEYDCLDTLETDLFSTDPDAVLADCAAALGVAATFGDDDPREMTFDRETKQVTVLLGTDGWLTIVVPPGIGGDAYLDLRRGFDKAENAHMLTEHLGTTREQADGAREFLDALSPPTLARLEAFAAIDGWICVESEWIEFECSLPLAHGDVVATLVDEAFAVAALIDADLAAVGDGVW